ncbi:MAG: hypothetical protein ACOX8A_11445, partial [Thermacetogeniaceae bacterium]
SLNEEKKTRDNYHTILIAKNYDGVKEINSLIDLSTRADHFYYNPRISFDEFLAISDNVIKISACLSSPLAKLDINDEYYDKLCKKYDYYEVQPHVNNDEQKEYNKRLLLLSQKYNKPLIAGTDTHNLNKYKEECCYILQKAKKRYYETQDDYTYKTYDKLVEMFELQNALPKDVYLQAIENTNIMADSVEEFELDLSFKYPKFYDDSESVLRERINRMYNEKVQKGIISDNPIYMQNIEEELRVFKKIEMIDYMLFMSELVCWCWENGIPVTPCRGSVGGSTIAFITGITDVDPVKWGCVFSRFANEHRKEIGDIDIDVSPDQRELVYNYIIERVGIDKSAFIMTVGTIVDKGTIDEIGRGLHDVWMEKNPGSKKEDSPYNLKRIEQIKKEFSVNPEETKKKYPEIFYYYDGLIGTAVSQSVHAAGIVASPVSLPDNYGTFWQEGKRIMSINMEEIHEVSLVKYDILGLNTLQIMRDTCKYAGIPYPRAHELNWEDNSVWDDILCSRVGLFQFESGYAFDALKKFKPRKIHDLSLVNAALRPAGASYRDRLFSGEINKNPSRVIDDLLANNKGYLIFQEDTIKFLMQICGLNGSDADNVRRAIGRKQKDRLESALPSIIEGYCNRSEQPRHIAEKEVEDFIQIISDSSDYQFGYNHSTGYSMVTYICAYLRYYYPIEFVTAYLNNSQKPGDIVAGTELARIKNIKIHPPKFRYSSEKYTINKKKNSIYTGVLAIKHLGTGIGEEMYTLRNNQYPTFMSLLIDLFNKTRIDSEMLSILVKLDFFSEFGNSKELLRIFEYFEFFKRGKAISINKEKLNQNKEIRNIVEKYSNGLTKTGKQAKSYTILNMQSILDGIESYIKSLDLRDFSLGKKIKNQIEYLGYIIPSEKEEDKKKFVVLSVKPIKRKKDGKQFGYHVIAKSIGTGKETLFTLYNYLYNKQPIKDGYIILLLRWRHKMDKYFDMVDYTILEGRIYDEN